MPQPKSSGSSSSSSSGSRGAAAKRTSSSGKTAAKRSSSSAKTSAKSSSAGKSTAKSSSAGKSTAKSSSVGKGAAKSSSSRAKPAAAKSSAARAKKGSGAAAGKRASAKGSASRSTAKRSPAKPAARASGRSATAAGAKPSRASASTGASAGAGGGAGGEDLRARLAEVRERLLDSLTIPASRLQEAVDETVRRGRMTRADAEELMTSLLTVGRTQTEAVLADIEQLLGRGRQTASRSGDRVLRQVDKARRAAGIGGFPIMGYDDLTAGQIADRLSDLTPAQLRKVRDYERRNANRKSVLSALEKRLA